MKKLIYGLSITSILVLGACSNNLEEDEVKKNQTEEATPIEKNEKPTTEASEEETPSNESSTEKEDASKDSETGEANETIEKLNVEDDTDVKAAIEKEDGVVSAVVTSMDANGKTYVVTDIQLENASSVDAAALAKKYADQLKEKYPDNVVDVKVLNDTETVAQETRE